MTDHYQTLGVSRHATAEEIKKAYRRLAREYHPDANPNDPEAAERFKEINRANEVLSDPSKRQNYDRFGDERPGAAGFGDFGGISDIFSTFFGGGQRSSPGGPARGSDVVAEVDLTLEEAATGVERDVELVTLVECDQCEGSGAAPGTFPSRCNDCGGTGELRQVSRTFLGNVMTATTCIRCSGTGQEISDPCPRCHGQGRVEEAETITVPVPPGIEDGAQLRISGRGQAGYRGGHSGDLYVVINIATHDTFRRAGDDLACEVSIPMTVAALGGEIEIPTLEGSEFREIHPGTQSGEIKRIKGAGMPRLRGRGNGELIALIKVETPTDLDAEQEALIRRLAEARGEPVVGKSLFGKIKEAFN